MSIHHYADSVQMEQLYHCMRELPDELTDQADIVLVDSPAVLPVTDTAVLAQAVDGVPVLIDSGSTRHR